MRQRTTRPVCPTARGRLPRASPAGATAGRARSPLDPGVLALLAARARSACPGRGPGGHRRRGSAAYRAVTSRAPRGLRARLLAAPDSRCSSPRTLHSHRERDALAAAIDKYRGYIAAATDAPIASRAGASGADAPARVLRAPRQPRRPASRSASPRAPRRALSLRGRLAACLRGAGAAGLVAGGVSCHGCVAHDTLSRRRRPPWPIAAGRRGGAGTGATWRLPWWRGGWSGSVGNTESSHPVPRQRGAAAARLRPGRPGTLALGAP